MTKLSFLIDKRIRRDCILSEDNWFILENSKRSSAGKNYLAKSAIAANGYTIAAFIVVERGLPGALLPPPPRGKLVGHHF